MKRGFTMVELLTVIAIIAILAAIIFPVAATVRERARRGLCTSNLYQIYTALEQYKLDEGAYPPALFGYILDNGSQCANVPNVPSMDQFRAGFLKPYLKSVEVFHCPNNLIDDRTVITHVYYPEGHALHTTGDMVRLDPGNSRSPILCFYRYDSYDIGLNDPARLNGWYYLRYTLFWTNRALNDEEDRLNRGATNYDKGYYDDPIGGKAEDSPRQLGYRNPDKTSVVTWCSYHRQYHGNQPVKGKNDLVLFLSGNVKPYDTTLLYEYPYNRRP